MTKNDELTVNTVKTRDFKIEKEANDLHEDI